MKATEQENIILTFEKEVSDELKRLLDNLLPNLEKVKNEERHAKAYQTFNEINNKFIKNPSSITINARHCATLHGTITSVYQRTNNPYLKNILQQLERGLALPPHLKN